MTKARQWPRFDDRLLRCKGFKQGIMADRVNVLGVGISPLSIPLAVAAMERAIDHRSKGYICVTGVHGVSEAQDNAGFRSILNRAFLNTPDGMPMVWLGKLAGNPAMDRVYGPDLMLQVCRVSGQTHWKHFFYGGAPDVAELLAKTLRTRFPHLQVVGTYTPPFRPLNPEEKEDLQRQVAAVQPDIIWVGLSTPKQEQWMYAHRDKLQVPVMLGVGAAFDLNTGRLTQAPEWMRENGLEWLFRLCAEPRRLWSRYIVNGSKFAWAVCLEHLAPRIFG